MKLELLERRRVDGLIPNKTSAWGHWTCFLCQSEEERSESGAGRIETENTGKPMQPSIRMARVCRFSVAEVIVRKRP